MNRSITCAFRQAVLAGFLGLAALLGPAAVQAADDAAVADVAVPTEDPAAVELGKTRYGEKCSGFCHGSAGKGGRAPCLVCNRFKHGASNAEIIQNITTGITKTPMGAFGEVLTREEILAVVAYLRVEQKKREAAQ